MKRPTYHLTQEELEALHEALDRARSNTTRVKVSREALAHILMDHARLAAELERGC